MKRSVALISFVLIAYPMVVSAVVGVAMGGKVGWAEYSGDILPSSGDLGGAFYYGAIFELTTIPIVDLELHANYFSKDIRYTYEIEGFSTAADFQFQDFNVLALLKKNLISVPASPFSLYVGAGLGWHLMNTEVILHMADTGIDPSVDVDPAALARDVGRMSADGLVGAKLSFPVLPLALYTEGRYGVIFTEEKLRSLQIEGGVMLDF